jgi:hypothetical protein
MNPNNLSTRKKNILQSNNHLAKSWKNNKREGQHTVDSIHKTLEMKTAVK